jgi:hypothetical protein
MHPWILQVLIWTFILRLLGYWQLQDWQLLLPNELPLYARQFPCRDHYLDLGANFTPCYSSIQIGSNLTKKMEWITTRQFWRELAWQSSTKPHKTIAKYFVTYGSKNGFKYIENVVSLLACQCGHQQYLYLHWAE